MGVNIGQAAKASGLSERMLRYFEKQGLVPEPARSEGGYRDYTMSDVTRMRMIALAQDVGLSTDLIRQLLAMMDGGVYDYATTVEIETAAEAELDRKERAFEELRHCIKLRSVPRPLGLLPDQETDAIWQPPAQAREVERPTAPSGEHARNESPHRGPARRGMSLAG